MDIDQLKSMKVEELKSFLRRRGLRLTGKKDVLVARAFVAIENNIPIVQTAEEAKVELDKEYQMKLQVLGEVIPDPFILREGWLSEQESIKAWPTTLYPDIFNFLSFNPSELGSTDLNDYKTSKAYTYYSEGWLNPINYHEISKHSKMCIFKGTCKPSQRVSEASHKLWVVIEKSSGKVLRGHCTCMAGFSQTCNHVAAILFRIEAAVRMGLTNPFCTSKPCEWLPSNAVVKPTKIKVLKLSRGEFGRKGRNISELNNSPKKDYQPSTDMLCSISFGEILTGMKAVCKEDESILFTAETKIIQKKDVGAFVKSFFSHSEMLLGSATEYEYYERLTQTMTDENIMKIEQHTRGQNSNENWHHARKHIITASKAHAVKTRMESHMKSAGKTDFTKLIEKIAGEITINGNIPALQYGREMEAEAVSCFTEVYKIHHKAVVIKECGLSICKDICFVGASPDRIINCSCCGLRLLEVKCPFSICHLSPSDPDAKLPFLNIADDGKYSLKRNHQYFTQCQVQMAATGVKELIFFVWTPHGFLMELIPFDANLWDMLKMLLNNFYTQHYIPGIFHRK